MSDLLNSASLVMIPSGYKEDTVYSVVPSDGSGDMSFTRSSNGTRVNSAGLVEVCPWNLVENSENFSAIWTAQNSTITTNSIVAPNGTTTADSLIGGNGSGAMGVFVSETTSVVKTMSCYVKKGSKRWAAFIGYSGNSNCWYDLDNGVVGTRGANYSASSITSVGNGWYRIDAVMTVAIGVYVNIGIYAADNDNSLTCTGDGTTVSSYIWGFQLNIGSTAKPYFPTTDRLNVPRLTYQNGGGGCPSLLLEKQSTNLNAYSQDFDNGYWSVFDTTITANTTISPDGTQNADTFVFDAVASARLEKAIGGYYENNTIAVSIYAKVASGTSQFRLKCTHAGIIDYLSSDLTVTSEWQRFTFTQTFGATVGTGVVSGIVNSSNGTAKTIQFWGLQTEVSSYPTSYIPTTSSSATRVADACFKAGISSLIGQSEGFIAGEVEGLTNSYGSQSTIMSVSDGTTANRIMFSFNASTGYVTPRIFKAGSTIFVNDFSITLTQKIKFAIGWGGGRAVCYVNGTQVQQTTGLTFFSSGTLTRFGADDGAGSNIGIGKVSEYILGTANLTNAQLQSLTL